MDLLSHWVSLAVSLIALASAVWAIVQAPSRRNADAFAKFRDEEFGSFCKDVGTKFEAVEADFKIVDGSLDTLKERMSVTESMIKQLPDKESVHRLELTVSELSGNLNVIGQKVEGVDRTARRVEEFLLEQAKVK
jgi:hypothetical protein